MSLSSWSTPSTHSSGGPPPLPQDIGHHIHVVQGAMAQEVLKYTSADDAYTSMPWPFEGVTPGCPIIDLPWSRTTIVKDTDSHRSSVGLVLSIPSLKTPIQSPTSAQAEVLHSFRMHSHVLTCGHHILPERAVPSLPMPMQRHSEHLNHQHRTFTYREKVRSLIAERVASIEFDTKKRLRAPGENEAKCKVIRIKELEQRSTISCFGERFSPFMHGLNTIVSISQVTFSLPVSFPEPRTSLHLPAILTSYHLVMRSSWTGC